MHNDNEALFSSLTGKAGAPVLVLSNSLGTTHTMWAPQRALEQHFQLLRYDTRGHGQSAKTPGPYSIEQLGRDVLRILDRLDIQQAAFCGISMGGLIGQWLGVNAPDRFTKLILANTAARIGTEQGWADRAAAVRSQGMSPIADGAESRWFTPEFIRTRGDVVATLVTDLRNCDAEGYAACCDALAVADLREQIAGIEASTLIIAGSQDPVTTPADSDFMAARIPNAERIDLPASHLSNIEAADGFTEAVSAFLMK